MRQKPWNGKLMGRLLVTVTVADPEQFAPKDKLVRYIKAFVEFYNKRNRGQVYEIYGIIELERYAF